MQTTVSTENFLRFAGLARRIGPNEKRQHLRSVWIEAVDGRLFIFATDTRFAAVQFLGNGYPVDLLIQRAITVDDAFIKQLEVEKPFGSSVIIEGDTVSTTFGYTYPGNPFVSPEPDQENEFLTWRSLFSAGIASKAVGCLFLDTERLHYLIETSPSAAIVFPPRIDTKFPVFVKDAVDDSWLGVFLSRADDGVKDFGTLPEWVNE